jgi:hypothetical protein
MSGATNSGPVASPSRSARTNRSTSLTPEVGTGTFGQSIADSVTSAASTTTAAEPLKALTAELRQRLRHPWSDYRDQLHQWVNVSAKLNFREFVETLVRISVIMYPDVVFGSLPDKFSLLMDDVRLAAERDTPHRDLFPAYRGCSEAVRPVLPTLKLLFNRYCDTNAFSALPRGGVTDGQGGLTVPQLLPSISSGSSRRGLTVNTASSGRVSGTARGPKAAPESVMTLRQVAMLLRTTGVMAERAPVSIDEFDAYFKSQHGLAPPSGAFAPAPVAPSAPSVVPSASSVMSDRRAPSPSPSAHNSDAPASAGGSGGMRRTSSNMAGADSTVPFAIGRPRLNSSAGLPARVAIGGVSLASSGTTTRVAAETPVAADSVTPPPPQAITIKRLTMKRLQTLCPFDRDRATTDDMVKTRLDVAAKTVSGNSAAFSALARAVGENLNASRSGPGSLGATPAARKSRTAAAVAAANGGGSEVGGDSDSASQRMETASNFSRGSKAATATGMLPRHSVLIQTIRAAAAAEPMDPAVQTRMAILRASNGADYANERMTLTMSKELVFVEFVELVCTLARDFVVTTGPSNGESRPMAMQERLQRLVNEFFAPYAADTGKYGDHLIAVFNQTSGMPVTSTGRA